MLQKSAPAVTVAAVRAGWIALGLAKFRGLFFIFFTLIKNFVIHFDGRV